MEFSCVGMVVADYEWWFEGREGSACTSIRGCVVVSLNGGRDILPCTVGRACYSLDLVLFSGSLLARKCDFLLAVEIYKYICIFYSGRHELSKYKVLGVLSVI